MEESSFRAVVLCPAGDKKLDLGRLRSLKPDESGTFGEWRFLRWSESLDFSKLVSTVCKKTQSLALLIELEPCRHWTITVVSKGKIQLQVFHPFDLQFLTNAADAAEHASEKYWTDHDLDDVAGILREDSELGFLWDKEEERRLRELNRNAKKERIVAKGFVSDFEANGIGLPHDLREKLLKKNQPHQIIKEFFGWQKKAIAGVFTEIGLPYRKSTLREAFTTDAWISDEFEMSGSLHKVLESIGAVPAIQESQEFSDGDAQDRSGSDAETIHSGDEEHPYWGSPPRKACLEKAYEQSNSLELADVESTFKVPLTQLDLLAQVALTVSSKGTCLVGIELPDGQKIVDDDIRGADVCYDGETQFLDVFDGFMRERHPFVENAPEPAHPAEVHDYIALLPDGTRLDLRVGGDDLNATMRWTGYVRKSQFCIEQHRAGLAVKDQKKAIKLFRETNGLDSYEFKTAKLMKRMLEVEKSYKDFQEFSNPKYDGKTVTWTPPFSFFATEAIFRVLFEGTSLDASAIHEQAQAEEDEFWDGIEQLDRELQAGHKPKRKGRKLYEKNRIAIFEMKSSAVSADSEQRKMLASYAKDLDSVGFSHVGNMICDVLGTGVAACFSGGDDIHAHVMISFLTLPEFWTRFENDDVLVTNFFSNESDPQNGVFFRSYPSDTGIPKLFQKHQDGIKKVKRHRGTAPIVHGQELSHFAEQLHFFLHQKRKVRVGKDGLIL